MDSIQDLLNDESKLLEVTKAVFEAVDTDASGLIDKQELKVAMETVAKDAGIAGPSDEDVDEMLSALDVDNSGTIDIKEFRELIIEVFKVLR